MSSTNPSQTASAEAPDRGGSGSGTTPSVTLGPRDSLEGKLTLEGDLHILGTAQGQLKVSGDVSIESKATVHAPIEASNVDVRGQLEGDVTAKGRLVLSGSGALNGNVKVTRLTVEDGATLNGTITMDGAKQRSGGSG
jgi:cytoskeletal protein CcmA (bactofilin family)